MSPPEVLLWLELRRLRAQGYLFRRQHPAGPFVLDFYLADAALAVEVDGHHHASEARAAQDRRRDAWLQAQGIEVLRYGAAEVMDPRRREEVVDGIVMAAERRRGRGQG